MAFLNEDGLKVLVSSVRDRYDVSGGGSCFTSYKDCLSNDNLTNDTYLGQQVFSIKGDPNGYLDIFHFSFWPHVGEWYTFSYFAKASSATTVGTYFYPKINGHDNCVNIPLTTSWQLVKRSLYISSVDSSNIQYVLPLRVFATSATVYCTCPILEIGRVAHPTMSRIPNIAINNMF